MKLSAEDLKETKFLVGGLQGTGKTYFVKRMSDIFPSVAVYTPRSRSHEWEDKDVLVFSMPDFVGDFPLVLKTIKKFKERLSCIIIDEADMLFKSHFDVNEELKDIVIGHRHYGLTLFFVTRRLQDIPTQVYGQIENLILFSIESPQVVDLLNKYYPDLGEMVKSLDYGTHQFVIKRIGRNPEKGRL